VLLVEDWTGEWVSASENKCKLTSKLAGFHLCFFFLHSSFPCTTAFSLFSNFDPVHTWNQAMIRVGGASLFDHLLHPHRPVSSNFLSVFGCLWQTLEFEQLDLELLVAKKYFSSAFHKRTHDSELLGYFYCHSSAYRSREKNVQIKLLHAIDESY
jgi:hypothetical protein